MTPLTDVLPTRVPEDGRRRRRRPRPRRGAARGGAPTPHRGTTVDAERLGEDRHRRHHHDPLRALRDGPGRLHRAAHAGRGGARGRPREDQGRDRARGRGLHQRLLGGQITGGSTSVVEGYDKLRLAGAQARSMLVAAAAQKWGVDPSACRAARTASCRDRPARRPATAQLAEAASKLPVPKDVKLKEPKDWRYVGKPINRLDSAAKIDGTAEYGIDVKLPGMLYAALAQCPVIGGKVASFDAAQGQGHARRETRGADPRRRGRGGGHLVAGQGRPRRPRRQVGRGRRHAPQLRRHRQRAQGGRGQAGRGHQEAGRRGRGGSRARPRPCRPTTSCRSSPTPPWSR